MGDQNGFADWGGYMDAKITKLEEQYSAASAPFRKSTLFAGISIYVNGLTIPSADELKRIMMVHGGTFHHYERSHTTFIIASNLPDVKVRNMNTSKIISAKWVVDCTAANKILDYTQYLLYTNQKTTQPRLNFGKGKIETDSANNSKSVNLAKIKEDLAMLNAQMRVNILKKQDNENVAKNSLKVDLCSSGKTMKANQSSIATSNTARTAVDPNFLPEFYNNSRLHHIATLGAGFKQYVNELREKHDESKGFPARLKLHELLPANAGDNNLQQVAVNISCVMHIDMDCFFVSVGLRKHPHLRGQPVAVTHSKGGSNASEVPVHPKADREAEMELFAKRFEQHLHNNILSDKVRNGFDAKMSLSEIASCSYEARQKGVRNGMFVGHALKLCPNLKTIPYDFDGYKEVAYTLYDTVAQYTLQIEAVSCDEMFVDLSDLFRELKLEPMEFVRYLRDEVRQKTGCPCSAGVGANKLQARMATKRAKPDGQYYLKVDDVESYMADIPADELPGVGSSTNYILKNSGYTTCADLQRLTLARLQGLVGKKHGETLYKFCRGIDNRPLALEQVRKSVSAEVNYGIRFKEYAELETFLRQLCTEVHSRLCQIKRKTKCITLKVMVRAKEAPVETSKFMGHGVCDIINKSVPLSDFTNDVDIITRSVLTTMKAFNLPPHELRGIGIQLTKLDDPKPLRESKENVLKNMFNKLSEKRKEEAKVGQSEAKPNHAATKNPTSSNSGMKNYLTNDVPDLIEIPKSFSLKESPKKRPNVFGMLQNAHNKKQEAASFSNNKTIGIVLPSYIDREVFDALPLEIRAEILMELEQPQEILSSNTTSLSATPTIQVENNDLNSAELDDQPSTSRAAFERRALQNLSRESSPGLQPHLNKLNDNSTTLQKPSEMNIFVQGNCNELLLEWVKSDTTPREFDISLCRDHAREMVRAKQLSTLHSALSYLRKIIESIHSLDAGKPWCVAYNRILEVIQQEVNCLYVGRKLLTRDIKL